MTLQTSSATSMGNPFPVTPTYFDSKLDPIYADLSTVNTYRNVTPLDYGAVGDDSTDDTTALQAMLTANTTDTVMDGLGRVYRTSSPLKIPNGAVRITLKNFRIRQMSDSTILQCASDSGTITFVTLQRSLLVAASHTTGKPAVDFRAFALSTFRDVWVSGTANKTVAFYGTGNTGGSAPYYNLFEKCYAGSGQYGFRADDNGSLGVNTNTLIGCRFQPGSGNTGISISTLGQGIAAIGCILESDGGCGIETGGTSCYFLGSRFESLDSGLAFLSTATANFSAGHYFSSVTTPISYAGSSLTANMILGDTATAVQDLYWPGPVEAFAYRSRVTTVVANYSVTTLDTLISANSSSTVTMTLPAASSVTGHTYEVRRWGTQGVGIAATSGSSFNDQVNLSIATAFGGYRIQSYGTGYTANYLTP